MSRDANLVAAMSMAISEAIKGSTVKGAGLDGPVPAALATVHARPDLTIEELSRILALSHSGTVRVADRLEAHALVARRRRGRTVALRLTRKGVRAAEGVLEARALTVDALLAQLPADTRRQLVEAACAVLRSLSTSRLEARHICRLCDQVTCASDGGCPVDGAATELERDSC